VDNRCLAHLYRLNRFDVVAGAQWKDCLNPVGYFDNPGKNGLFNFMAQGICPEGVEAGEHVGRRIAQKLKGLFNRNNPAVQENPLRVGAAGGAMIFGGHEGVGIGGHGGQNLFVLGNKDNVSGAVSGSPGPFAFIFVGKGQNP